MSSPRAKRMMKERGELEKNTTDYFVHFKDDDLFNFDAYVFGPDDTLYEHKLFKLRFEIPSDYPFNPPKVTFIEHDSTRIHPNLYADGKVCLSILGTWPGEPWALAMNCNTVLITIRSLLDNQPYMHEPDQPNNPDFNKFVQYATWKCCLLDYLGREEEPALVHFLHRHIRDRGTKMLADLSRQEAENRHIHQFSTPYSDLLTPNYSGLFSNLKSAIDRAQFAALLLDDVETSSPDPVGAPFSGFSSVTAFVNPALLGSKRPSTEEEIPDAKRQRGSGTSLSSQTSLPQSGPPPKPMNQTVDLNDLTDD